MRYEGCIFDLDGTLLDSLGDLADSMNAVLAARGFPVHAPEAYRGFVGDGMPMLVQRALPPHARDVAEQTRCIEAMAATYAERWNVCTEPYAGIAALLEELQVHNVRLAVLSNKPDPATQRVVAHYFGADVFDPVVGMRPDVPRKPDPAGAIAIAARWGVAPATILYVGDTDTDMRTAVGAGMVAVGALWGFREAEELRAHGARHLCATPADVAALLP